MINKVILVGRLGKDPEKRSLPSGAVYVRFSVATNESYKDKDGNWADATEWHNIIIWRDLAERAEKQLKKGSLVYLEGKLSTRSWQDQDGQTKSMTEITANTFRSLEKREGGNSNYPPVTEEPQGYNTNGGGSSGKAPVQPMDHTGGDDNDDLPF